MGSSKACVCFSFSSEGQSASAVQYQTRARSSSVHLVEVNPGLCCCEATSTNHYANMLPCKVFTLVSVITCVILTVNVSLLIFFHRVFHVLRHIIPTQPNFFLQLLSAVSAHEINFFFLYMNNSEEKYKCSDFFVFLSVTLM